MIQYYISCINIIPKKIMFHMSIKFSIVFKIKGSSNTKHLQINIYIQKT
jgi:hypothetical protein